jgi:hypothetical protein
MAPTRTYSYQGEVITCLRSHPHSQPLAEHSDYCQDPPSFNQSKREQRGVSRREAERYYQQAVARDRQLDQLAQQLREKEEYGLRKMEAVRKQVAKEVKKMRRLYRSGKDRKGEVLKLEEEARLLTICQLQQEKKRLVQQLYQPAPQGQSHASHISGTHGGKCSRAEYILSKPSYRGGPSQGEESDSSFSSF